MESLPKRGTEEVSVPESIRVAIDADARAQNQCVVGASLLDSMQAAQANAVPCRFCEQPVTDVFRPRTLLQVMDTTHNQNAFSAAILKEPEDTDDTDASMQCSAAASSSSTELMPHHFPALDEMFTPVQCCSAPCWMAATLLRYGESDMIGLMLKRSFPTLMPSSIGGAHYERYNANRAMRVVSLRPLALLPTRAPVAPATEPMSALTAGEEMEV